MAIRLPSTSSSSRTSSRTLAVVNRNVSRNRNRNTSLTAVVVWVATAIVALASLDSVAGQGCSNTCPPINYGVVVPALCEGDRIDTYAPIGIFTDTDALDAIGIDIAIPRTTVTANVRHEYDICETNSMAAKDKDQRTSSFKFDDFRGTNVVTVLANYYTGCNAGRRESGVFAHIAQKYYDIYGPDKVHFIQSVKGGGTCDQWASIYQSDAADLFPGFKTPVDMPWTVDDSSYLMRDQFFTSPFGHPAYLVLDGNLEIKHKFIGPCCGYEQYNDCTPEIAKSLDTTLSGYLDAILNDESFTLEAAQVGVGVGDSPVAPIPIDSDNDSDSDSDSLPEDDNMESEIDSDSLPEDDNMESEIEIGCEWSEWSACSIRCGPTPGVQIRYKDRRCEVELEESESDSDSDSRSNGQFESRSCRAENPSNCNVEDLGLACVPEFGGAWNVREGVVDGLDSPRDVKFHPTPGYHLGASSEGKSFVTPPNSDEAWIINGNNHTMSIVTALDTAHQSTLPRRDRGYYHYMINGTAISFNSVSDSGRTNDRDTFNYWAICNDNSNTYAETKEPNFFMGPTLYDSNPNRKNLVNRLGEQCDVGTATVTGTGGTATTTKSEPCYFLHSDMLHEAPSCRGIVHDSERETAYGTVYWAFDSTGNRDTGQLVRFDFQQPHGPGSMDHSVASVRRYVEVELETAEEAKGQAGVHAGMIVHPNRRELFIAVPGKNQILRVGADSGKFARTAREEFPIFSNRLPSFEYSIWECVDRSVFVDGINQPSGMALSLDGERLFVAERGTGKIHAYEVVTGSFLHSIQTRFKTIGGMDFAPESGDLYFVDDETNTLNSIQVVAGCFQDYASRKNPEYTAAIDAAKVALGLAASEDPFDLIPEICSVDPIVPNATFFDQVHLDTGYASDNPDVQSIMAGMDAAAALLANRTDCGYDSELNFDALLLGGYFCHICLPEQYNTCDGGGSCQNIQWLGYTCDNEFQIVANLERSMSLPGSFLLQTMNGTTLDANELVLMPGITYKFFMMVADEEICLSTPAAPASLGSSQLSRSSTRGCATNGLLEWTNGDLEQTGSQIFVNSLGDPIFPRAVGTIPTEQQQTPTSSSPSTEKVCFWMGTLFGLLFLGQSIF